MKRLHIVVKNFNARTASEASFFTRSLDSIAPIDDLRSSIQTAGCINI